MNYDRLVDDFINEQQVGDFVISHHFVLWLRKNRSIPIHPKRACHLLDNSQRLRRKRLTNQEKYDYWQKTGRWVRIVWTICE